MSEAPACLWRHDAIGSRPYPMTTSSRSFATASTAAAGAAAFSASAMVSSESWIRSNERAAHVRWEGESVSRGAQAVIQVSLGSPSSCVALALAFVFLPHQFVAPRATDTDRPQSFCERVLCRPSSFRRRPPFFVVLPLSCVLLLSTFHSSFLPSLAVPRAAAAALQPSTNGPASIVVRSLCPSSWFRRPFTFHSFNSFPRPLAPS